MGYFQDQTWSHKGGPWITADRGTVDEFGQLHFLGRADKQVKIRGQRLELPEIERIIHGLKPTYTWVSFAYETEFSSELGIAYQGDKNYEMELELQQKILGSYPSYYLPSVWIAVAQFTMNQNGKISSEPLIAAAKESAKTLYSVENTKADFEGISSLMKGLFNKDINPEDHFFTLGLSSFDAMYFVREWNAKHPKKLQVFQLFSETNFGSLSKVLMHEELETVETFHQNEAYLANPAQEALWFEIQHQDSSLFN